MIEYSIIIPHYKTGRMTAYCLHKIIQHTRDRNIRIVIISNSGEEGLPEIMKVLNRTPQNISVELRIYPSHRMQSHGIAIDFALENMTVMEHFIVLESDSFPVNDNWLDWYDEVVAQGGSCTGSVLTLSGGTYIHPAGAMYTKSDWQKALEFVRAEFISGPIRYAYGSYTYFPNMAMKEGFPCHLMVRSDILQRLLKSPLEFGVHLHSSYLDKSPIEMVKMAEAYNPISKGVFHNGMGALQESFNTYRLRHISRPGDVRILGDEPELIYRMGYEPGQWFSYWLADNRKDIFEVPTETKWMPGRENQQQEYTLTANGVKHLWGMTAYNRQAIDGLEDITQRKNSLLDELYMELPADRRVGP